MVVIVVLPVTETRMTSFENKAQFVKQDHETFSDKTKCGSPKWSSFHKPTTMVDLNIE